MSQKSRPALIESLESRQLLSGASVVNGILRVRGERLVKDVITVGLAIDGKISVSVQATASTGASRSFSEEFATTGLTGVHIFGGRAADTITIDQTNGNFTLPTVIDGGRGNDTITAGSESDTIFGGLGDDVIVSGDGNDLVYGGPGNDSITAGNGNDRLWGGSGADTITAGNGTDTFGGILGKNTLTGGTGPDTFYESKTANNVTSYNSAKDTLKLVHHGDPDDVTSGDPTATAI